MPELCYPNPLPAFKSEDCLLAALTEETDALRQHRLDALRAQIAARTYRVPAEQIAARMLCPPTPRKKERSHAPEC